MESAKCEVELKIIKTELGLDMIDLSDYCLYISIDSKVCDMILVSDDQNNGKFDIEEGDEKVKL